MQLFKTSFSYNIEKEKVIFVIGEINKGKLMETLFEMKPTTNYDVQYLLNALKVLSESKEE